MASTIARLLLKPRIYKQPQFLFSGCIGTDWSRHGLSVNSPNVSSIHLLAHKNYSRICSEEFNQRHPHSYCNLSQQVLPFTRTQTCPLRYLCPDLHQDSSKMLLRYYSASADGKESKQMNKKELLKKSVKEYGTTVIVFHVTISMTSLGCCYLAVTSGLNLQEYLPPNLMGSSEIAAEASLFVVAYAMHKVLAPIRMAITLFSVPFIVRYLRKINVLKANPKNS